MPTNYFEVKNILLIKNYKFDNGLSKDKLLILLYVNESESIILQALVTSQDKVPDKKINHGCTNSSDNLFSFYMFEEKRVIGERGFSFNKNTFIHFQYNLSKVNTSSFLNYIPSIEVMDKVIDSEYKRLLKCILNSKNIKRSLKTEFEKIV